MARDDESHFIFVMPVFAVELREHLVESRRCWIDVDYVSSNVPAANLQLIDLSGVRLKNLFGRSIVRNRVRRLPALVIDAVPCKTRHDLVVSLEGCVFVEERYYSHYVFLLMRDVRPIVSSRNSRISMCRLACARVSPHE